MKPGRYLVVNGDDFGVNHAHNLGVRKAFTEGILTSAGIITAAPWFAEAIHLAQKHRIPVGVHLALSCEYDRYQFGPLTRAPELSLEGQGHVFPKRPADLEGKHVDLVTAELRA